MKKLNSKGFTLLEILLIVAALAILSGIVILATNPGNQLSHAKNDQRKVDINIILNAVYQYSLDHNGLLPTTITSLPTEICKAGGACTDLIDLSILTTNEKYLTSVPVDPIGGSTNGTGYTIVKTIDGRVAVTAPKAEQGATISATR